MFCCPKQFRKTKKCTLFPPPFLQGRDFICEHIKFVTLHPYPSTINNNYFLASHSLNIFTLLCKFTFLYLDLL